MIVRSKEDMRGTNVDVHTQKWSSLRLLTKADGVGYTMTDTTVRAGTDMTLWYKNHLESCYCIAGHGEIEDLATGEIHVLGPGSIYSLDKHDRHRVVAKTDMRLICTFTPALSGQETHDADGSYTLG